ncbi:MAG: monofunctional biosynthetic peptidoglycan transglycosylase [Cyclobacteriaceae bacterium]|jgi:monofunctional biosynthetic peptidoglycan transglycosylase|nr:monofunctional biosynthetic peptidoglycan transglycosylase [Flammeovirgaceae bacterium]
MSALSRLWQKAKKFLLFLFLAQFAYIVLLKWVDPPITITQLTNWVQGHGLRRDYVDYEDISPYMKLAVMASEDQLFPDHNGFDIKSIQKALQHNKKKPKRVRGASTISQQVAKNVFLWQGRSWVRKVLEVYFTFMIELVWGKERILEVYLNVAETGTGIFGVEAAAQAYFKKPAKKLSRSEAAMIAACLPNPKKYKVKPLSKYVERRYPWIVNQMYNLEGDEDIEQLLGRTKKK